MLGYKEALAQQQKEIKQRDLGGDSSRTLNAVIIAL